MQGGRLVQYNPESGKLLREVLLPTAQVTSVAFGGADMDELYVTTGREDVPAADRSQVKHAFSGQLFRVRGLGVKGLASQVRYSEIDATPAVDTACGDVFDCPLCVTASSGC